MDVVSASRAGTSLDVPGRLNYRKKRGIHKVESFSLLAKLRREPSVLPWRATLCLLLVMLLFYNPFITVRASSGPSVAVQHPLSYRSTIASSELGCGAVQNTKLEVFPLKVLALVGAEKVVLLQRDDVDWTPTDETVRAVPQDFAPSLWFRPPPVV